jgi:hypothetical protein
VSETVTVAAKAPKASVRVVRVTVRDDDLRVNVRRGLGFQAVCACGWQGKRWHDYRQARAEKRWHSGAEHGR